MTNLDIHDISRSAKTFGFEKYFVITPVGEAAGFGQCTFGHWGEGGKSGDYNPDRSDALSQTCVLPSSAANQIIEETGLKPIIALTGLILRNLMKLELAKKIKIDNRPCHCYLVLLGFT